MVNEILYIYADPKYFEALGRARNPGSYVELVRSLIPRDWATFRFDIWFEARPPSPQIPDQGFKLHLSASVEDAAEVLKRAVPVLVRFQTSFKVLADSFFHALVNSKRFPRGFSGKFITIYPSSHGLFCVLAHALADVTRDLHGPYILSDRRHTSDGIVYYRYGAFKKMTNLRPDGSRRSLMRGADGLLTPDERLPFFKLPDGQNDPFPDPDADQKEDEPLNGRYRVEEALNFTNTGGVYRSLDLRTGQPVVIKEARPYTLLIGGAELWRDATEALRQERRCLQHLQSLACVPRLIDSFIEWEHHFLVESYVTGTALIALRAQESFIIMDRMADRDALIESCVIWRDIGLRLLSALDEVHDCGVVIGDISPLNILRNDLTGELTFIDLESASFADANDDSAVFGARWSYPGFRPKKPNKGVSKLDDYYSSGMLLYDLICPIQALFDLDRDFPRDGFLKHFVNAGLPTEMADIVYKLWAGDAAGAFSMLHAFSPADALRARPKCSGCFTIVAGEPDKGKNGDELKNDLTYVIAALARNVLASMDFSREDRLWPSDPVVFETNPLSLGYGACGTTLFLNEVLGTLPDEIKDWILKRNVNAMDYPPGLYPGMAGIAWCFAEFGCEAAANAIMRLVPESPLAYESTTLFDGVAGWGFAALALFTKTQDEEFLGIARTAGACLIERKQVASEGLYWRNSQGEGGPVKLGMGFGGSGIGLFLLNLWKQTKHANFLEVAKGAIEFDIAHAIERARDGALNWPYFVNGQIYSPYWVQGSGGVASSLIRFYALLGEERYLSLARRAAMPCADFFSVAPHSFEGLASMGETLLDMYQITGEKSYYEAAALKARQILLYKIKQTEGVAFPGRFLVRISHDYGAGGAGIGLFFQRLITGGRRNFHDLRGTEGSFGGLSAKTCAKIA